MRFGVDRLIGDASLARGAVRIGLLTNDAARPAADPDVFSRLALQHSGLPLTVLFSPEHGIGATGADGAPMPDVTDAPTGLPVVSLYGERFEPPVAALEGLDLLLVDLPDVGARFYTYAWTMTRVLDDCAARGLRVLVLDRPNPLGGLLPSAEGPLLDLAHASMVGRLSIPIRHSLTIGELARLWERERLPRPTVEVVPCDGWRRAMQWPDTGLPFIPTSPAMPSFESALLYPGTCLFEATNVGVGRGTPTPFRLLTAPWLDAEAVARAASRDPRCAGVELVGTGHELQVQVSDRHRVRPVAMGLALLERVSRQHHGPFAWSTYPTAANPTGEGHLERLVGTAHVRVHLDAGERVPDQLLALGNWEARVGPILLYG